MLLQTAYLFFLTLMCFVGFTYGRYTDGAAARTLDGPYFCNELQSSGSDDTAVIGFAFIFFSLPLLIRLLRFSKGVSKFEIGVLGVSTIVAVGALLLASLDCAEIFYTAFGVPDPHLAAALLVLPTSLALLIRMRIAS
ncbi:hypothetical protein J4E08_20195 [Sagittula sp. NFXS13]|uniref:hypothetical protein n=1 Tax=Sagittula sp. NFXS13 TaxID=2819095 RepID=UPI0032DFB7AA